MNILDRVIGVKEAAELWGLSPGTVKNMCAEGHVKAKKVGPTWVIDSAQPTPVRRPARVEYKKKAEPDPDQITLFDDAAAPEPVIEPEPAPLEIDLEDLEYFADLHQERIERDGLDVADADDRLRAILAAYEFAPVDQERILDLIKERERSDGTDRSPE